MAPSPLSLCPLSSHAVTTAPRHEVRCSSSVVALGVTAPYACLNRLSSGLAFTVTTELLHGSSLPGRRRRTRHGRRRIGCVDFQKSSAAGPAETETLFPLLSRLLNVAAGWRPGHPSVHTSIGMGTLHITWLNACMHRSL